MEISRLDSLEYEVLNFPYNKIASELSNVQRIVHGQNTYVTLGGKIAKRPGTTYPKNSFGVTFQTGLGQIADRVWVYETLDNPPQVYLLGSFRTGSGTWEMRYTNFDFGASWVKIPDFRNINTSTVPHELVVARGLAFIRGVPPQTLRINSGGPAFIDSATATWSADMYNSAPDLASATTSHTIDMTGASIATTDFNQTVAQSRVTTHLGLSYFIPVPAGKYDIKLLFSDWGAGSGINTFNIVVQGTVIQTAYDPYVAAGNTSWKAVSQTTLAAFPNGVDSTLLNPTNPYLKITLLPTNSPTMLAYISAIEIIPHGGAGDGLGTVIFDGNGSGSGGSLSTPRTKPWGVLGPQTAVGLTTPSGWPASKHNVTVNFGWQYVYSYVTITGQISNRSPLQTDPTAQPSITGAFTNKTPHLQITGLTDTVNFPYINIYRTMDGGGTFYFLQQIANTGGGTIDYYDNSLFTSDGAGTANDPIPDTVLNTTRQAPSLTSNSPPPTTLPPNVTGIAPVLQSSPLILYAGRIWYFIGNYLFYSALEELGDGIPLESFPSGPNGNFFVFSHPGNNLVALPNALLTTHTSNSNFVLGQSKDTFIPVVYLNDIGSPPMHPRAIAAFNESVAFLTHDYRIALIRNGQFSIISDPLFDDIPNAINTGGKIYIDHWAQLDKDYLVVSSLRADDVTKSQQWVYDVKKSQILNEDFWFTPWSIRATASVSGRVNLSSSRYQLFWSWDGTNGILTQLDPTGTIGSDQLSSGAIGYPLFLDTHQMHNPAGNHVNILSEPPRAPIVEFLQLTRSMVPGDTEPEIGAFIDDLWTKQTPLKPEYTLSATKFPRKNIAKGFRETQYNYHGVAQRVAFRISKNSSTELFELHRLLVGYDPGAGS